MIVFTVHEPPNPPADRIDRAEKLEFVRDGFNWLAGLIPPLWMALNRLWIALLVYLLAFFALNLGLQAVGVEQSMIGLITFAANIVVGFEADSIKRWTLERRGWGELGTVTGRNRAECERRFFDGWLVQQPMLRPSPRSSSAESGAKDDRPFIRNAADDHVEPALAVSPASRSILRRFLGR
jgi:Protein of unknown function (DUF2628)